MRAVVNVSSGGKPGWGDFGPLADRLDGAVKQLGETLVSWRDEWPKGSPPHDVTPYAFKTFALVEASKTYPVLLWADASIVPIRPLDKLWELIESQGYWFSENLPKGTTSRAWTCGQWTSDAALEPLGITRKQAFRIPQVIAGAFGLDLRHEIARRFLAEYFRLANDGAAFRGGWSNSDGKVSKDKRVLGHRHDQTAASVIAWRLAMNLTVPPAWIVNGIAATPETVLEIRHSLRQSRTSGG